jgi:natural product biosynthesis luciferase-like monooxygenase protein
MQQGMLFHHLSDPESGVDVEQIVCTLREELDVAALRRAWQAVHLRHAVLRSRFRWEGVEDPVQEVVPDATPDFEELDWRDVAGAERAGTLDAFLREDRRRGLDLAAAPLSRLTLMRVGEADWRLLWTFHHAILDGRSFPIVLEDAFDLYAAECGGETFSREEPRPYADHADALAAWDSGPAEAFWRERLADFSAPTALPPASDGSDAAPENATGWGLHEVYVPADLTGKLRDFARSHELSTGNLVQGAWALLLSRYGGEPDVVFGATRACRRSSVDGADSMVGLFINTLPVRVQVDPDARVVPWLQETRARERAVGDHEQAPLVQVQAWSDIPAGSHLFDTLFVFENYLLGDKLREPGGAWEQREFVLHEKTNYPLALYGYDGEELLLKLAFDPARYGAETIERMMGHLLTELEGMIADPERKLRDVPLLSGDEERKLAAWNATDAEFPRDACVHQLVATQAGRTPDEPAVSFHDEVLTYRELDARANQVAHHLKEIGVGRDDLVALCVERSLDLIVGVLGILKSGAAYLPLDPAYPRDRIAFMLEDAKASVILTQNPLLQGLPAHNARVVCLDADRAAIERHPAEAPASDASPDSLAYVIYTSGSTGKPKGVMVEHRNVANFFTGMDARVPHDPPGVWLAVTSLSFDISVLELLWTLARGFRVVIHKDERHDAESGESDTLPSVTRHPGQSIDLSLFFFAAAQDENPDHYRLLLEAARFGDEAGFAAVWTPERHFHGFGGIYPNPAVAGAAIAAVTRRIGIRSGSVVLPLHHPARVAEEWSVVDNLSNGRVGIACASGWHPRDFVLRPESFADNKKVLFDTLDTVRRLWRGESVPFPGPDGNDIAVRTLPRPVQAELPVWITTAGSEESFRAAGEVGANVLTHLLGQTVEEVGRKIAAYRAARREHGHSPDGQVALMLHTFIGDDVDVVRETVRGPMTEYLRSAMGLVKNFASSWSAFKKREDGTSVSGLDFSDFTSEEVEELLDYSFERYFETSALFGTPERCLAMVDELKEIGVDEVACLIDFGVETDAVLEHLGRLNDLREAANARAEGEGASLDHSLAAEIERHSVTHMQCTPSMASMALMDDATSAALKGLQTLLVGWEVFRQLRDYLAQGSVLSR